MKKPAILITILFAWASLCVTCIPDRLAEVVTPTDAAANTMIQVIGGSGGAAPATPDFSTDYEGSNADCTAIFDGTDGTVNCDDSTHDQSATDDMFCDAGVKSGGVVAFGAAQTAVWFETYVYVDETLANSHRLVSISDDTNPGLEVLWGIRNSSGYKWWVKSVDGSHVYGTATVTGQTDYWIRGYASKGASGAVKLWYSTNGTNWTLDIDTSGYDTDSGADWASIWFGANANNNLACDWYFDDSDAYWGSNDPGW